MKSRQSNSGSFKKGNVPWNTGTIGIKPPNSGSFRKGERRSPETEFKKGNISAVPTERRARGERHGNWKGDDVGYEALHAWVYRNKGPALACEKCGRTGDRRHIHWANKSHEYKREISDWLSLCVRCHKKHDKNAKGLRQKRFEKDGTCVAS